MGLRYTIPFKGGKDSYIVEIHREDYDGEPTELRGGRSCFVVSGNDEDFMYTPIRTSTATIQVLDSDLLLDLYSINNHYAPVKLYKNGTLEWTGYIKPEQFTQPYVPTPQNIGVDCVSALATLENIEYKRQTDSGFITMWELMKLLVSSAEGGYKGIYIPQVYGSTIDVSGNVFAEMQLAEENFTEGEMNHLEVLEYICKFLGWTVHDVGGFLYFVDSDWEGEYRLYDEQLNGYVMVEGNSILVQDVGYNGAEENTLDVVPGYNKASVKAVNNIFEDILKDEDYDMLEPIDEDYYIKTYNGDGGPHGVRKRFMKPEFWNLIQYKDTLTSETLSKDEVYRMKSAGLNKVFGALLLKEADYRCISLSDQTPEEDVEEFNYKDSVQIRVADTMSAGLNTMGTKIAMIIEGKPAVYADCAISIDCTIDGYFDDEMVAPGKKFFNKILNVSVECGGKFYNGSLWVDEYAQVSIGVDENGNIKSNKTPFMTYSGISGYVIPIDFLIGVPKITIFCPVWMNESATHHITGTIIRNLSFSYSKKDGIREEGEDGDRVYENVVNERYMSEADEIEFGISSYNADGATYSKVLLNGDWLTDNLYCAVVDDHIRPEELLIRRIVNRYGVTRIKLTEAIWMNESITPLTILTERSMPEKKFRITSGEWDYEQNRLILQMQEDVE